VPVLGICNMIYKSFKRENLFEMEGIIKRYVLFGFNACQCGIESEKKENCMFSIRYFLFVQQVKGDQDRGLSFICCEKGNKTPLTLTRCCIFL